MRNMALVAHIGDVYLTPGQELRLKILIAQTLERLLSLNQYYTLRHT
jgi:hypothetical protein